MATERLGNLSYAALTKESTPGTPLTPTTFFQLYKGSLATMLNQDKDNPISGVRSAYFNAYMGLRSHTGQIDMPGEVNTMEYFWDMLLSGGGITGGGDPYTHPFTEGLSNSYTI